MKEKLKSEMTLREYYAGLAMQGILTNVRSEDMEFPNDIVILSKNIADKLMEELNKREFEEARNLLLEETERKRIEMEKDPRWVTMTNQEIEQAFSKKEMEK